MTDTPTAYPLSWPASKPRTEYKFRRTSAFKYGGQPVTIAAAIKRLQAELDRLRAHLPVLSSNIELRIDGLPRSSINPSDPGVAVYFQLNGKPMVLACDTYYRVEANIAAIAAHIDAMRTAARHGVGSLEQLFAGFLALPPAGDQVDWRKLLEDPQTLAEATSRYRDRMRYSHPDVCGDAKLAENLNLAIAAARRFFGSS